MFMFLNRLRTLHVMSNVHVFATKYGQLVGQMDKKQLITRAMYLFLSFWHNLHCNCLVLTHLSWHKQKKNKIKSCAKVCVLPIHLKNNIGLLQESISYRVAQVQLHNSLCTLYMFKYTVTDQITVKTNPWKQSKRLASLSSSSVMLGGALKKCSTLAGLWMPEVSVKEQSSFIFLSLFTHLFLKETNLLTVENAHKPKQKKLTF